MSTEPDWQTASWLVVDTETTGLDDPSDPCCIVELGAVIMREGKVVAHRSGVFNPGKPIHPKATEVHGFTDAHVADRARIGDRNPKTNRTPVEGLDLLCAEHDVRAIVAYNAPFDLPIMRRELGDRWYELEDAVGLVVDPLVVVRLPAVGKLWKGTGRHKLTAVAARYELDKAEDGAELVAHRAVGDCIMAGRVLWHLREHVPADVYEARRFMASATKKQQQDFDRWLAAQPERKTA